MQKFVCAKICLHLCAQPIMLSQILQNKVEGDGKGQAIALLYCLDLSTSRSCAVPNHESIINRSILLTLVCLQ